MFKISNELTQKYTDGEMFLEEFVKKVYEEFNEYILNMIDEVFKDDFN